MSALPPSRSISHGRTLSRMASTNLSRPPGCGRISRLRPAPRRDGEAKAVLHGRGERAVAGVDDLVTEEYGVFRDVDHTGGDVKDVSDPKLTLEAHVGFGRARRGRAEPERVQHHERRVAQAREVERDGEVLGVVDLPAVDGAAGGLEPAHRESFRPMRFSITCVTAEKSSLPQPFSTASA